MQSSLSAEIRNTVPRTAPDQFVLDIPVAQKQQFQNLVARESPGVNVNIVPTLRGTIVAFGGTRVAHMRELPTARWFPRGESGVTYGDQLPAASTLVEAQWGTNHEEGTHLLSTRQRRPGMVRKKS